MTPDIVLTHGCILAEDEKERRIMTPYPPLGLLYVAAYLKREGYAVEVLDPTLGSRNELEEQLRRISPSVLGLYATFLTRSSVLRIAAVAGDLGWTIVVGGPDVNAHAEEYLNHGAHVVVYGEGEQTMAAVLEVLGDRGRQGAHLLDGIAGTVFRDPSGDIVRNQPRELIADLDDLPWPDREMVDIPAYLSAWRERHGSGPVSLITARGCAYRCDWCSHAVYGRSHRRRSPGACADEVEYLMATYRPDRLWYADDVFTIHQSWLETYASELAQRNLRPPFETITRADRMMDPSVVETLAAMGCERLWIGAESGSERLLRDMQRDVTPTQIIDAATKAREHGIKVGLFLMWGYGDERMSDIEATIDMVRRARPDIFLTTLVYPIKGTGYWEKVGEGVVNPNPWAETSDQENQVLGRPGREHYKLADSWLKASVAEVDAGTDDSSSAAELAAETATARARLLKERRKLGLER